MENQGKKNKNKNKNADAMEMAEQPLAIRVGPAQRAVIDMGRGLVARGTVKEMILLGRALAKRPREGGEEREREALARVLAACELGEDVLAYNAGLEAPAAGKLRADVVRKASAVKLGLARWAKGTTATGRAAADLQRNLFPPDEQFNRMPQRTLWEVVAKRADQLREDGELRAALAVFVPEAATAELFAANDALGAALPRSAGVLLTPIDVTTVIATMRAHTQRYAAAVIAAVDPDDADAVRSADQALRPLAELRSERRARRRLLVKAEAKGKAAGAVAAPATAPPVPAVDEDGDDTG